MKNSDKIPSPLADKLDAFEFPFDETAWASFEALRPADKPKPKTPYRFLGFGLMLLGLAVALFFYNKKNVAAVNGTSKGPLSISAQKSDKGASMLTFEEKTKVNEVKIFDVQNSIAKNALLKMDTAHHLFPKDGDAVVLNTNYSDKKPFEQHLVTETAQKALVTNAEANIKQQKESNPIANATSNQKNQKDVIANATSNQENQKDVIANATSNQENQKESTSVNTASLSLVAPTTPTDISNETSRTTAIPPLSILPFLDTFLLQIPTQFTLIPSMTKPLSILRGPKNSLRFGYGAGLIKSDIGAASAFTMSYVHRFTPLMSLGLNMTYANKNNSKIAYVFSTDVQLNFTLYQKHRFNVDVTTGYGYRSWFFNDANQKGEAKGVTLGLEANYCFWKDYFVGLRVDRKVTYYKNTGFYVQIGKYF